MVASVSSTVSCSSPATIGRLVEPELRQDARHLQRVDQVRLTRLAHLALVDLRRVDVGLLDDVEVRVGVVRGDPLQNVVETNQRNAV